MYPFERFTEQAKRILTVTQEEAEQSHQSYIGTEHMLVGLAREEQGLARIVLDALGCDSERLRTAVASALLPGEPVVVQQILPTLRLTEVIELAFAEAHREHWAGVGTEHLLLALVMTADGVAADVLRDFAVTLKAVRSSIAALCSEGRIIEELRAQRPEPS